MKYLSIAVFLMVVVHNVVGPPVTKKKTDDKGNSENEVDTGPDFALGIEYDRYLKEVVQVLESDDDFRKKLEKAEVEDIRTGKIAKELEYVNHNVRTKLDELKRTELERLRHLAIQEYEASQGIDKKRLKIPAHVDHHNPHTFEIEDLRKLIVQTTKELEEADRKRKVEFKEYEMQKEFEKREQLKTADEAHKKEISQQYEEQQKKHKEHPQLHHPGSKQQLEEVWEKQDHMSPEDFNPRTFFHLHDLDGNGFWDTDEVKALFQKELDKMYDPTAPEDDMRERMEEMERMREHVFNETDTNRDALISYEEFLEQTKRAEFEQDNGWEGLDQQQIYSDQEFQEFERRRQEEVQRMIEQGLIPPQPAMHMQPMHGMPQDYHPQGGPVQMHPGVPQGYHPQQVGAGQGYHPQGVPMHPQGIPAQHPQGMKQQPVYHHPNGQQAPAEIVQLQQQQQQQQHPQVVQQQQQHPQVVQQQQQHPQVVQQQQQQHPQVVQQQQQQLHAQTLQQQVQHPSAGFQPQVGHPQGQVGGVQYGQQVSDHGTQNQQYNVQPPPMQHESGGAQVEQQQQQQQAPPPQPAQPEAVRLSSSQLPVDSSSQHTQNNIPQQHSP